MSEKSWDNFYSISKLSPYPNISFYKYFICMRLVSVKLWGKREHHNFITIPSWNKYFSITITIGVKSCRFSNNITTATVNKLDHTVAPVCKPLQETNFNLQYFLTGYILNILHSLYCILDNLKIYHCMKSIVLNICTHANKIKLEIAHD